MPNILREITQSLITLFDGEDIVESTGGVDRLIDYLLEDVSASDEPGKGLRQLKHFLEVEVQNFYQANTENHYKSSYVSFRQVPSPGYSVKEFADNIVEFVSKHCDIEETKIVASIMGRAAACSQEHFGYLGNKLEKVYSERLSNNKNEHRRMDDKPIIITGGHFYGSVFGNVDKQYIYPNKPEEKPEAETKTTNGKPEETEDEKPADKKTSDNEPDEEKKKEEKLRKVLISLASVVKGSHKYKWGLAKQALVRMGMINSGISINEFADIVQSYTGVPSSTVRNKSKYYFYDREYEDSIKELCNIISETIAGGKTD